MSADYVVARALFSVSDKKNVAEFARALSFSGAEILSTGGTAAKLREENIEVRDVSSFTESPEVMNGRVKTLHPRVHGGILMRDNGSDLSELERIGGAPIDLVCVNLYPFRETVARGAAHDEVLENIDIGGPSMLRSAAKNHPRVLVVVDPEDYDRVISAVKSGDVTEELRQSLAGKAFAHTAAYDAAISNYFASQAGSLFPSAWSLELSRVSELRYGENPHQKAAFYREATPPPGALASAKELSAGGKELSFNNYVDLHGALEAVREFDEPAAVVVKHTNPCGIARGPVLAEAYRRAREADATSAFGGIVALNRKCDLATAEAIAETFIECVVAPEFAEDALERLRKKKKLRILAVGEPSSASCFDFKRISGGFVVHEADATGRSEVAAAKVVTKRSPTDDELRALDMAWRTCKHVKSNAIVLAGTDVTLGVGAGQMSRVLAVEIACKQAGEQTKGAALASDAFFPFADGVEAAIAAGVTAVVQPGGSVRDEEVIAAADKAGIAMIVTGTRHFKH